MNDVILASTLWAGSPLEPDRLRTLLELGFEAVALHAGIRTGDFEEARRFLPPRAIATLPIFAPHPGPLTIPIANFRLGSLHAEEKRDALERGLAAIEIADRADIPALILPPIELDDPPAEAVLPLLAKKQPDRVWEGLRRRRAESARRQLPSLLSTLARLLDHASRYQRRLLLTVGGLPHELPDVDGAELCLREFSGAPLFLAADAWRDVHYRASGGTGGERLRAELRERIGGVIVRDPAAEMAAWEGAMDRAPAPADPAEPQGPSSPLPRALASPLPIAPRDNAPRFWILHRPPSASEREIVRDRDALRDAVRGPDPLPYEPYLFRSRR